MKLSIIKNMKETADKRNKEQQIYEDIFEFMREEEVREVFDRHENGLNKYFKFFVN